MNILKFANTATQQKALEGPWFYQSLPGRSAANTLHNGIVSIPDDGPLGAFEAVKEEFLRDIAGLERLDSPEAQTIEDVYDITDQIQERQGSTQSLRNLNRIKLYLERSSHYSSVIQTFVKVKPVHTGIIWVR